MNKMIFFLFSKEDITHTQYNIKDNKKYKKETPRHIS